MKSDFTELPGSCCEAWHHHHFLAVDPWSFFFFLSEVAQSCPTLFDPMDCSLPGSVHGVLQARILE